MEQHVKPKSFNRNVFISEDLWARIRSYAASRRPVATIRSSIEHLLTGALDRELSSRHDSDARHDSDSDGA